MIDSVLRKLLLFLEPVGFVWLGLVVMAIWLWRRKQWGPATAAAALSLVLFVAGGTALPSALLGSLERPFADVRIPDLPAADAVVMLGGGATPSPHEASGFHITIGGDRILTALELMRLRKAPVLVLGGGSGTRVGGRYLTESEAVRDWLQRVVPAELGGMGEIVALPRCRHTHDEALRAAELARERGWRRVLLVTSAWHLPRAAATFRTAGLEVIPAPCNFLSEHDAHRGFPGFSIPKQARLGAFSFWLHEQIGWLEYRRRGWIRDEPKAQVRTATSAGAQTEGRNPASVRETQAPRVATFSIVARDADTGELGIAVQSRVVASGAVVPWARAGVGAVATQAWANPGYGPRGLDLLISGKSAAEAIEILTRTDDEREERQVGIVDAVGRAASFTGERCRPWAGGRTGKGYAVQGNLLAGEAVVDAMAQTFESARGELGQRLLDALAAGQRAGGDRRGQQSAALLIVREGWGYGGLSDRYRDLRVDDHPEPITELQRIYEKHRRIFPQPRR